MKKQVEDKIREKVIYNYTLNNYGLIKSGREFNIGERAVRRILKEANIPIRSVEAAAVLTNQSRRILINDNYFDNESSNMAYILGFIASDGTVRKDINEIKITINEIDTELLEKIKNELQYQGDLRHYEDSKGFKNVTLAFTSQKIKSKLAEYNIIPQKTFNFIFPMKLNKKYWIDFIRGYFDGDGSVSTAGSNAIRWQICAATTNILDTIITFFTEEFSIPPVSVQIQQKVNPYYSIQYSTNATKMIHSHLYTPNSIYLKRKKDKFDSLI